MPKQISIICNDHLKSHGPGGNYTVICDGIIEEGLTWDEMLGQVASVTLVGKLRYRGHVLGDDSHWWKPARKLLTAGKEIFPF